MIVSLDITLKELKIPLETKHDALDAQRRTKTKTKTEEATPTLNEATR